MNELFQAVSAADEDALIALANKGIFKRACKDIEGMQPEIIQHGDTAEVLVSGETVTLKAPLTECRCTCVSRTVCRHIVSAILLMKRSLPPTAVSPSEPEKKKPQMEKTAEMPQKLQKTEKSDAMTGQQIEKTNACAEQALSALAEILRDGLVRTPNADAELLEVCAVSCHTLKMADAERAVRDVENLLLDCIARRASFSSHRFCEQFFGCVRLLRRLSKQDITTDELGVFRQQGTAYPGKLTILPIGERQVTGGEYEGEIYYFLNMDENAERHFLTFSDLRPIFYDNKRMAVQNAYPWGLSTPLKKMMRKQMVLANAAMYDGKLSSSQETSLVGHSEANLNCPQFHKLILDDFNAVAAELYEREPKNETDRLFLIHPSKVCSAAFDKYAQTFLMQLEDCHGRQSAIQVQYRAETKTLIEILEKCSEKMLSNPEQYYVMLVSADIADGRLQFFPIEIYDFIDPQPHRAYELPDRFVFSADDSAFADAILRQLLDVQEELERMLQCGLQSGFVRNGDLETDIRYCGMSGLADMTADWMSAAENYRHGGEKTLSDILAQMDDIFRYLEIARNKLELITALQ